MAFSTVSERLSTSIYSEDVGNLGIMLAFRKSTSLGLNSLNIQLKAFISDIKLEKLTVRFPGLCSAEFS